MQELVGCVINVIYISDDHTTLVFGVDIRNKESKFLIYEAYGDCCSSSWFNDLTGVEALLERKVVSVESVELPDIQTDSEYELIQAYGYKITTSKGYCDLVFRNSSNGYYGGSLELEENPKFDPTRNWFKIMDDWSADY